MTHIELAYLVLVIGVFVVFALVLGITEVIDRHAARNAGQPEQIRRKP